MVKFMILSNHNHMVVRHMVSVKILQPSKRRGKKLFRMACLRHLLFRPQFEINLKCDRFFCPLTLDFFFWNLYIIQKKKK